MADASLAAVLDRLLALEDGTAAGLGLDAEVAAGVPAAGALLERLPGFEELEPAARDEALRTLEAANDETFAALVAVAHAVWYADPRSWPELGYTTNLPGRP